MLARACGSFAPAFAGQYYSTCAVGFSAVLFAMKVVLNSNSPGWSSVAGISLPTKVSSTTVSHGLVRPVAVGACTRSSWTTDHFTEQQKSKLSPFCSLAVRCLKRH